MSEIANTTFQQLGGRQAMFMISGKASTSNDDLFIRFKGSRKSNVVKIHLNGKDLYDVTFSKMIKYELKEVSKYNDVYAEDLMNLFEKETGLYLTLYLRK